MTNRYFVTWAFCSLRLLTIQNVFKADFDGRLKKMLISLDLTTVKYSLENINVITFENNGSSYFVISK
jgi:hypothetical protein